MRLSRVHFAGPLRLVVTVMKANATVPAPPCISTSPATASAPTERPGDCVSDSVNTVHQPTLRFDEMFAKRPRAESFQFKSTSLAHDRGVARTVHFSVSNMKAVLMRELSSALSGKRTPLKKLELPQQPTTINLDDWYLIRQTRYGGNGPPNSYDWLRHTTKEASKSLPSPKPPVYYLFHRPAEPTEADAAAQWGGDKNSGRAFGILHVPPLLPLCDTNTHQDMGMLPSPGPIHFQKAPPPAPEGQKRYGVTLTEYFARLDAATCTPTGNHAVAVVTATREEIVTFVVRGQVTSGDERVRLSWISEPHVTVANDIISCDAGWDAVRSAAEGAASRWMETPSYQHAATWWFRFSADNVMSTCFRTALEAAHHHHEGGDGGGAANILGDPRWTLLPHGKLLKNSKLSRNPEALANEMQHGLLEIYA